jgi:predicted ATPase
VSIALTLLADVRWRGRPVAGDRPQALLAALATRDGRPVRPDELIELVWGDDVPSNGQKSLQVLVSRARTACGADAIVRDGVGYRLGAAPGEVDSGRLAELVRAAVAVLDRDAAAAEGLAREALELAAGLSPAADGDEGPLAEVRRAAAADAATARVIAARASSRAGAHAGALPILVAAHAQSPQDEPLLADLLRSEAAVSGPAAALERFERYRRDLRERLGADPGELLQRTHRGLLALDRPVRRGVHYDATELIGRDADLARLRALMASARVVSVIGAGGLGKTRLAHALARDAAQPVVHFVELAGVTAAADVAVEVGSVLGVRDSVSGRRTLTAEQRADIRARIAQRLAQSPSLLVLDNCEHLIEAAAELTAFLIAAAPDLRVLTTSRAPLAIAAERVYPLGELETGDAAQLFRERAVAARPGVRLTEPAVTSIVGRLDGLPLAIELAAARVRAMSVEEIDRRLEDRFALLRGGDRSAPGRHQTLLAVIEWSWNLLDAGEQRALRRLALFPDGFTLEAAEVVLGSGAGDAGALGAGAFDAGAFDAVRGLVDQSLLSVAETPAGIRYRMLETVREFGRLQLAGAGEDASARAALRRWAVGYASAHQAGLTGTGQFAAVDAVSAEETNLADELRAALADGDRDSVVRLLAALGLFWTMRGEHFRLVVLARAVAEAVRGWLPPPDLASAARAAVAVTLNNSMMIGGEEDDGPMMTLLRELGPDPAGDVYLSGLVRVLLAYGSAGNGNFPHRLAADAADPAGPPGFDERLTALAADPDRHTAAAASQWLGHERENAGDPVGAIAAAQRVLALVRDEDGPWSRARPHALLAELTMHVGDHAAAAGHALTALPVMQRIGAGDDELQLRTLLVFLAIGEGRLADAADELARMDQIASSTTAFGWNAFGRVGRAELALAAGDAGAGLELYRESAARMREVQLPGLTYTGMEPWVLFGEAMVLGAHARYAAGDDVARGEALFRACRAGALRVMTAENPHLDYPASGLVLFALGMWSLLRRAAPAEDALRLLALADRFAYNRMVPTMRWERITPAAEEAAPGLLARLQAEYRDCPQPGLLEQARLAVERLPALHPPPVAPYRQRREDRDHGQAGEQRPAGLAGDDALVGQAAGGGDQVRDRVDLHERRQPARQGGHRHEGVGQEGQREQDHHRHALHGPGALGDGPDPGEDPGQRPAGEDREQHRAEHAQDAAAGPVTDDHAGDERQAGRDQVAHQVGDHRAGQRGDPGHRHRLEPVEDALVHVLAQVDAGGHAGGQDGLGDDTGDQQRQVAVHVAGDRAAEEVGEHGREQQRLDGDVEELLHVAAHLLQRAPGHDQRLADCLGDSRARASPGHHGGRVDGVPCCGAGGCRARGDSSHWTSRTLSSSAPWPVIAKKTSSRVGLSTLTEVIASPDWRKPISTSAARSAVSRGTFIRPDSGVRTGSAPATFLTICRASS